VRGVWLALSPEKIAIVFETFVSNARSSSQSFTTFGFLPDD
jgi:hypothetical protein